MADASRVIGEHLSRKEPLDVQVFRIDALRSASRVRTTLLLIFVASGLLLLIACANAGNMLLALAVARRHEVAVRRAGSRTAAWGLTQPVD